MTEPIEDRDSYVLRELHPSGTARGWRRTGCIAMLGGAAIALVSTLVAVLVFGPEEDPARVEEPCDLLEIQLAYLEGQEVGSSEPAADVLTRDQLEAELARVRRGLAELDC